MMQLNSLRLDRRTVFATRIAIFHTLLGQQVEYGQRKQRNQKRKPYEARKLETWLMSRAHGNQWHECIPLYC